MVIVLLNSRILAPDILPKDREHFLVIDLHMLAVSETENIFLVVTVLAFNIDMLAVTFAVLIVLYVH